jgi:hypothetical protein
MPKELLAFGLALQFMSARIWKSVPEGMKILDSDVIGEIYDLSNSSTKTPTLERNTWLEHKSSLRGEVKRQPGDSNSKTLCLLSSW